MDNKATKQLLDKYFFQLHDAAQWILRSERKDGGSSAQFVPFLGWSKAYPETTGYTIPTLIDIGNRLNSPIYLDLSVRFGDWLLSIQNADGSWNRGKHPSTNTKPSIFNTGQILLGLVSLWDQTHEEKWIQSATMGANWLMQRQISNGLWDGGDYKSSITPSYYSHVLWPMLEVSSRINDSFLSSSAAKGIYEIVSRRQENGVISGWSFREGDYAYTHTIAYTIRGLQEASRLLDDYKIAQCIDDSLDLLIRRSELSRGALPGCFNEQWHHNSRFVCLTGSLQVAHCILIRESSRPDLREVSAAARMIDFVCSKQSKYVPFLSTHGGIAGSAPFWGPYLRCRFPNWAAKYFIDAIIALTDRFSVA